MSATDPSYPTRPPFFSHRFCRLLAKACLANQVGAVGCWMLTVIANTEDAKGYRGPVSFWNDQLLPLVGLGSVDALERLRKKLVKAGWLHYKPGRKGAAATYWVTVPETAAGLDDAPTDERASKYVAATTRTGAAESAVESAAESAGDVRQNPRVMCGRIRGESAEHSSLTLSQDKSPSDSSAASPADGAAKKSVRSTPKTPHHQAIARFCDSWAARYGGKYPFNAGKDAAAVKWMLGQVDGDLDRFAAVVSRFLADDDSFVAGNRHDVGTLRMKFARWLVDTPIPPRPSLFPPRPGSADYILDQINGSLEGDD